SGTGAEGVGKALSKLTDGVTGTMLGVKEVVDYIRGEDKEGDGNFLSRLIGSSEENERLQRTKSLLKDVNSLTKVHSEAGRKIADLGRRFRTSAIDTIFRPGKAALDINLWALEGLVTGANYLTGRGKYHSSMKAAERSGEFDEFIRKYPTAESFYQDLEPTEGIMSRRWSSFKEGSGRVFSGMALHDAGLGVVPMSIKVEGDISVNGEGNILDDGDTLQAIEVKIRDDIKEFFLDAQRQSPRNVV